MNRTSDIELRRKVLEELEWDPSIDARTIGVGVEDNIVALSGHVESYAAKMNAERIVKRVQGVIGVANDIDVKLISDMTRDDVDIARSAVNALEWNVTVPKNRIKVTVTKGWVTLDGSVEWFYQKRAAEEAVAYLLGVRGVSNNVTLSTRVHPEDVKGKIEAALKRHAEIDAKKIAVGASEGKVTLSGTVRSWVERQDVVSAAWSAPGVTNVIDEIRVHA